MLVRILEHTQAPHLQDRILERMRVPLLRVHSVERTQALHMQERL